MRQISCAGCQNVSKEIFLMPSFMGQMLVAIGILNNFVQGDGVKHLLQARPDKQRNNILLGSFIHHFILSFHNLFSVLC